MDNQLVKQIKERENMGQLNRWKQNIKDKRSDNINLFGGKNGFRLQNNGDWKI